MCTWALDQCRTKLDQAVMFPTGSTAMYAGMGSDSNYCDLYNHHFVFIDYQNLMSLNSSM